MATQLRSPRAAARVSIRARAHFPLLGLALAWLPVSAGAQLRTAESILWHQGSDGVATDPAAQDWFGAALAIADFDGDGRQDLAVGAPGEAAGAAAMAGAVHVLYQRDDGLVAAALPRQLWHQGVDGLPGVAQANEFFGAALTAGDFDGDGYADLAIGAQGEAVGGLGFAGSVTVVYGTANGLHSFGAQVFDQNAKDANGVSVPGTAAVGDAFGAVLAVGDFDGDGFDDLAIGAHHDDVDLLLVDDPGTVLILYGGAAGLHVDPAAPGKGLVSAVSLGGSAQAEALFGWALAAADFDGDGCDDLAIGSPGRDVGATEGVGQVTVVAGGAGGLGPAVLPVSAEAVTGLAGTWASGASIAAGDVDGDGYPDVVFGEPGYEPGSDSGGGRLRVLYGEPGGLRDNVLGAPKSRRRAVLGGSAFGREVTVGDFDGDGHADVAWGGSLDALPPGAGAVDVRYSGEYGPASLPKVLQQGYAGVPGEPAEDDQLGYAMAAGDLTGDGIADLVMGAPGDEVNGVMAAGSVTIVPGAAPTCTKSATSFCLEDRRFRVTVDWQTKTGASGVGKVVGYSPGAIDAGPQDSGLFWFFAPDNWEMLVKVVDGCGLNDRFWIFAAATTNVGYTLRVEDTRTGEVRELVNPLGQPAQALADTSAFATCTAEDGLPSASVAATATLAAFASVGVSASLTTSDGAVPAAAATTGSCVADATTLCLGDGRFALTLVWKTKHTEGRGRAVESGADDSGLFWFFQPDNWELLVKVLDGCPVNDHFWVFAAATTNVEYDLVVRDTVTGESRAYHNPQGVLAHAVTDTSAFAGCAAGP